VTDSIVQTNTPEHEDLLSKGILILLLFILVVIISAVGIWLCSSTEIPPIPINQALVHSRAGVAYSVSPEPVERMIFIVLAALCPCALVVYFYFFGLSIFEGKKIPRFTKRIKIWLPVISAILLTAPFIPSEFIELILFPTAWEKSNKVVIVLGAIVISLATAYHNHKFNSVNKTGPTIIWWILAFGAITLQIFSYRISSIDSVTLAHTWSVHVDAALYALNQVVHGNTITANLPSQYGFFPEIVSPVFKGVGLSIFSLTVFFAVVHAFGLIAIASLLRRHVSNSLLSILVFLTISISMSLFIYLNGNVQDIYIQYFPIRFFWPVFALLLFSIYTSKPNNTLFYTLGIVSGFSVFWNIDTGIPVLVSIGATLLVKPLIVERSALRGIGYLALFTLTAISTLVFCFIALRIKAGVPLALDEALAAQKIFYITGFGMIPMPISLDPWQAVLAIYAAGAITALSGWQKNQNNKTYDLIFCSAVMGLGLFTYYQGRSHVYCLILVSWPAILIGGILTDMLLKAVRTRATGIGSILLTFPFLIFFSLGAITFAVSSMQMAKDAINNFSTPDVIRDPVVANELRFMRETYHGRDCLILSQRQAIYSAELNIASPLDGPGIAEMLLQHDLDKLVNSALTQPLQCIYLGVSEGSITFVDVDDAALKAKYPIISKNSLGTIMLLEPRTSAALR
jgi:hypothetical protein